MTASRTTSLPGTLSVASLASDAPLPARARSIFLVGPEEVEMREVQVPRPGPGELLVAIEAATTCGTDLKVFRRGGHPRMLEVPGPFGHEMTGRVVAAGSRAVDVPARSTTSGIPAEAPAARPSARATPSSSRTPPPAAPARPAAAAARISARTSPT